MRKLLFIIGITAALIGCQTESLNEDLAINEPIYGEAELTPPEAIGQDQAPEEPQEEAVATWNDGVNIVLQADLSNPFLDKMYDERESRQYRDIVIEQAGLLKAKTGIEFNIYVDQWWLTLDWIEKEGYTAEDYPILDDYGTNINYFEGNPPVEDYSLLQWTISSTFSSSIGFKEGRYYSGVSGSDIRDEAFKIQNVLMKIAGVEPENMDTPPTESEYSELGALYGTN